MKKDSKLNKNLNIKSELPTEPACNILKTLHLIIDKKFKRTNRTKKVNPILLEQEMTLWTLADEFKDIKPSELSLLLKELVAGDSVVTNLGDDGIYPFDAYFIPKTEMINKENFIIYNYVKSILHGG